LRSVGGCQYDLAQRVIVMGLASVGLTELSYRSLGISKWYSAAEISSGSEGNVFLCLYTSAATQLKQFHRVLIQATTDAME
jgi:hypothetical protein